MKWILVFFASVGLFSSCGVDIQSGSQGAGQRCFFPSDCAPGLTCYQRTCTPIGDGSANNQNNQNNINNQNNHSDVGTDTTDDQTFYDIGVDLNGNCDDGRRLCVDESTRAICVDEEWQVESCPPDLFCSQGDCVAINNCTDRDGDGYGNGCPLGPDCDDRNGQVYPDRSEDCNTPYDDNCNGAVNEECGLCCPGGCFDGEFCNSRCDCQPFEPGFCQFQNQPCVNEGSFENDFYCISIDGFSAPRCYGLCNNFAPDPSSTCPEPGSVCAFGDEQTGICFSGCNFNQGCGGGNLGCLAWGSSPQDGMCIPTTNNQLGDPCDANQFFDCAEGSVCIDLGGPQGGRCREACRPFEYVGTPATDCDNGHCIAFSSDIGICRPDNNSFEGDACNPQFTTCNEDAVGCYGGGGGGTSCQRLCRLSEGNLDCPNALCMQFDAQQDEIGACVVGP